MEETYVAAERQPIVNYRESSIVTSINKISVGIFLFAQEILFETDGRNGRRWDVTLRATIDHYFLGDDDNNKFRWEIVKRTRAISRMLYVSDKNDYREYFDEVIPWARGELYNAILNDDPKPDAPTSSSPTRPTASITKEEQAQKEKKLKMMN